jgi:hypothetical protein
MDRPKSLIILGAGSSTAFAYPTGPELINFIANEFVHRLKQLNLIPFPSNTPFHDSNDLIKKAKVFAAAIRIAKPVSIDAFLSRKKPDYDDIGKFAIAFSLLIKEKGITDDYGRLFHQSNDNWQKLLFEKHFFNHHFTPNIDNQYLNTEFISFNYEYSFESAFHHYITVNFKPNDGDFKKLLSCRHVYGVLHEKLLYNGISFSPKIDYIFECAKNIEVMYSNRTSFSSKIAGYQEWLYSFEKIYFLGFAFDDDNLKRIHIPEYLNKNASVYGTAINIDMDKIGNKFKGNNIDIKLIACTCKELISSRFI